MKLLWVSNGLGLVSHPRFAPNGQVIRINERLDDSKEFEQMFYFFFLKKGESLVLPACLYILNRPPQMRLDIRRSIRISGNVVSKELLVRSSEESTTEEPPMMNKYQANSK